MSITCGKKARKRGGNRYSIKKSWRRNRIYRTTRERAQQHEQYERSNGGK